MRFFAEHKKGIFITTIIILLLTISTTFLYQTNATLAENIVAYVILPSQKAVTSISSFFSGKIDSLMNKRDFEAENKLLIAEIEALKAENERLLNYEKENQKLTELLKINQKYAEYEKIAGTVVANDPGIWYNRFVIDKGSNDGISNKMLVITPDGLIGYISKTGKIYSQVISILDDATSMSVMSTRTEDIGILRGDYMLREKGLCRVDYFSEEALITVGDEIVTSPLSGFPPGIKIGTIIEVKTDTNSLTKYAIIEPDVSFKHVESVLVIKKEFINPVVDEQR